MTKFVFRERESAKNKSVRDRVGTLLYDNYPFPKHEEDAEWFAQAAEHVIDIVREALAKDPAKKEKVGCVVCWLDPNVRGEHINPINVIYDGNGYCTAHWVDLTKRIVKPGSTGMVPRSEAMPLILAGLALEVSS